MAKNRKHYYENTVNPTNTFKVPKGSVEIRGRYTEAQIEYLKFKYFWAGAATGVGVFGLIYTFLNLYLKLS